LHHRHEENLRMRRSEESEMESSGDRLAPLEKEWAARLRAFLGLHGLQVSSLSRVSQSLTHRSYAFEHDGIPDNERLEFLGDAVLGCLAADFLFRRFPDEAEGDLSRKKSFLVSRRELWRRGRDLGLSNLILLGRGEESSGGAQRVSVLGSALEALVGALYFDLPFELLRIFVEEKVLVPGLVSLEQHSHPDYKSRLQELVQKRWQVIPEYRKAREAGPAHEKNFVVEVYVGGRHLGTGTGARIKTAENQSARQAYDALIRIPDSLPQCDVPDKSAEGKA